MRARTGGDWENGGHAGAIGATGIYGSWSPTLGTTPVNKNNWILGPNADPIPRDRRVRRDDDLVQRGLRLRGRVEHAGSHGVRPDDQHVRCGSAGSHVPRAEHDPRHRPEPHGGGDVGEVCTTFSIPVANLTITKTADASPVNAGDQIGFTVEVKNTGNAAATSASLNDPLPAGSGTGVTWAVDNSTGTPAKFVLSGAAGSQTLGLASSTIPIGADYTIHITASTSATGVRHVRQHRDADLDRLEPASGERVGGL